MGNSNQDLQRQVAVVTGAARGLGRHIALALARAGKRVLVNYVSSHDAAEEIVRQILESGGTAASCRADVRSRQEMDRLFSETMKRWGTVAVVINSAGVNRDGLHIRMSEQNWDDVITTNLTGPFHVIRSAAPYMIQQRHGHIINIGSITGIQGREGQANYSASKAGLVGLTKAAARELGRSGIQVNMVLPGFLMTDMANNVSKDMQQNILRNHCLERTTDADEVTRFICHLAHMKNVSGQIFNLDSRIL
jgi:3-oxoacyl-[acyl-carrier protein] reductase